MPRSPGERHTKQNQFHGTPEVGDRPRPSGKTVEQLHSELVREYAPHRWPRIPDSERPVCPDHGRTTWDPKRGLWACWNGACFYTVTEEERTGSDS